MQSDQYLTPTFQVGQLQCDQLFELRCDVVAMPPLGPTTVPLYSEKTMSQDLRTIKGLSALQGLMTIV